MTRSKSYNRTLIAPLSFRGNKSDKKKKKKLDESRFMRGGIRLAFDDDRFGGKKMSIIMNTGVLDIPNSQHRNFLVTNAWNIRERF